MNGIRRCLREGMGNNLPMMLSKEKERLMPNVTKYPDPRTKRMAHPRFAALAGASIIGLLSLPPPPIARARHHYRNHGG
jgi:hypothetical protein